jgi:hypothetical protein
MASALPYALSGVGAILSGIGRSKPQTSTSTFNNTGEQTANLDPRQNKVNKSLFHQILAALNMGPTVSQSDRNVARGQINDTYNGATTNMEANLAARGYGESGKVGKGFRDLSVERGNAFQGAEATLRDQSQNRFQQTIQNALAFMTPRSFSSNSSGSSTGTMSGVSPFSTIGSSFGDLSSLMLMQKLGLFGAGGGGGGYMPGMNPNQIVPCRVAAELYGTDAWQTMALRGWMLDRARVSLRAAVAVGFYALTGKFFAWLIRWNNPARAIAKSVFDGLLTKMLNA